MEGCATTSSRARLTARAHSTPDRAKIVGRTIDNLGRWVRQCYRREAAVCGSLGQLNMIVLFTDFGLHGPYTGQVKAVLHQMAPGVPAIDLFADAPVGSPKPSAYLLGV